MRYLLLSVLVVCVIGVMIPSVFGQNFYRDEICPPDWIYGPEGVSGCLEDYNRAQTAQIEGEALEIAIQSVIILAIIVTVIIVVIILIRKHRRGEGRSIEEYSNKRKRKNVYVVLCFVSSPLLFFADLFADLLTWIPISSIWKLLIPLIPIFVGIWYLKTTTSKPKPNPAKRKPAKKKETSTFCENCGNTLNPTAKFCGSCGTPVS